MRTALFHSDPLTTEVAECLDVAGCELEESEHHALQVRGEHSTERYSCEHEVHVILWHELTPADHPAPSCSEGCAMTVERL